MQSLCSISHITHYLFKRFLNLKKNAFEKISSLTLSHWPSRSTCHVTSDRERKKDCITVHSQANMHKKRKNAPNCTFFSGLSTCGEILTREGLSHLRFNFEENDGKRLCLTFLINVTVHLFSTLTN